MIAARRVVFLAWGLVIIALAVPVAASPYRRPTQDNEPTTTTGKGPQQGRCITCAFYHGLSTAKEWIFGSHHNEKPRPPGNPDHSEEEVSDSEEETGVTGEPPVEEESTTTPKTCDVCDGGDTNPEGDKE